MRKQSYKMLDGICDKNRLLNTIGFSTDLCEIKVPRFYVTNTTKIPTNVQVGSLNTINLNQIEEYFIEDCFAYINYGYLYNWYAISNDGEMSITSSNEFRVPQNHDFITLINYLGGQLIGGGKLKSIGFDYWNSPNSGATNEVNFNLRGGGFRFGDGTFILFKDLSLLISSEIDNNDLTYAMSILNTSAEINLVEANKNVGGSVRLVRDIIGNEMLLSDGSYLDNYVGNDGRIYNTIKIGTQVWLSENLVETKYRNGTNILNVTDTTGWSELISGAYCAYNNDQSLVFHSDTTVCFCGITWTIEVIINNNVISNNEIKSSNVINNSINILEIKESLINELTDLNINTFIQNDSIYISRPYGCEQLTVNLNLYRNPSEECFDNICYETDGIIYMSFPIIETGDVGVQQYVGLNNVVDYTFTFTDNIDGFLSNNNDSIFKFDIYKYNNINHNFDSTPVYTSNNFYYSAFTETSAFTTSVDYANINMDGDYIIKGYIVRDVCTNILSRLGIKLDTSTQIPSIEFNHEVDYYFIAITNASKPKINTITKINNSGELFGFSIRPNIGQTEVMINVNFTDYLIVSLNGLVLAKNYDYTFDNEKITFLSPLVETDVITIIGTRTNNINGIYSDTFKITVAIPSGAVDNQGLNNIYYNTTYNKYEIYTTVEQVEYSNVIITLNGIVLAPNVDYYQSTSNKKRIILNGEIKIGDVISVYYYPITDVVGELYDNQLFISWFIDIAPQLVNGYFVGEVSTTTEFTSILFSGQTDYVVGINGYSIAIPISGTFGTKLYYRIKNVKNYANITGDIINSVSYSDIIPITLNSNKSNSY